VAALARAGRATELPGIGATLQQKIVDLLETGTIPAAEKLRARFPPGLLEITALPGLGPKRARRLFDELGIDSLESLRAAAEAEQLRELKGFGPKFESTVLAALAAGIGGRRVERVLLDRALAVGELVVAGLRELEPAAKVELAGSARRRVEAVKDLDVIVAASDAAKLLDGLGDLEAIETATRASDAAARGVAHTGLTIEVRAVEPDQFGNLLQHLTGSADHNAALRERAVRAGLHVSEYGVLSDATGETRRCASEADVYELLGLQYIEPELRENRGEIEAAARNELPELVELEQIRGDLHCHTIASDGRGTIEAMALAARDLGHEYLAITDHSATHGFGNDVSPDALLRQIERVRNCDAAIEGIQLLAGSEVNILPDGSPDYDDELLEQLDWAIGSMHTSFSMSSDAMTERVIKAIEHPLIDAIGHPTGRLIGRREPYGIDLDAVIAAAARQNKILEINSNPNRRDLSEIHARAAAAGGVGIAINSDAHGPETLSVMRYGVWTARRAWLTAADVVNTLPWEQLAARLRRTR
jgi:DNA polymerase (family 10)